MVVKRPQNIILIEQYLFNKSLNISVPKLVWRVAVFCVRFWKKFFCCAENLVEKFQSDRVSPIPSSWGKHRNMWEIFQTLSSFQYLGNRMQKFTFLIIFISWIYYQAFDRDHKLSKSYFIYYYTVKYQSIFVKIWKSYKQNEKRHLWDQLFQT